MGKSLVLLALLACFAAQGGAQVAPPSHSIMGDPNRFADAHLRGLDAQVQLSDKQKEAIRPVFFAEGQKLIAVLSDPALSEQQRSLLIQHLHLEAAGKVASLLTPEQRKRQTPVPAPAARPAAGSSQI
jgi:Spy/CpxP family protein refolding chaperone